MKRTVINIVLAAVIVACGTPEVQPSVPAVITNPGPETRQELELTVSTALNGANVTLAEDALTENSMLVIERGMNRGIDRPPELGRDLGRPHGFQLVIEGSQCVLVDQQSGQQWPLTSVKCVEQTSATD